MLNSLEGSEEKINTKMQNKSENLLVGGRGVMSDDHHQCCFFSVYVLYIDKLCFYDIPNFEN